MFNVKRDLLEMIWIRRRSEGLISSVRAYVKGGEFWSCRQGTLMFRTILSVRQLTILISALILANENGPLQLVLNCRLEANQICRLCSLATVALKSRFRCSLTYFRLVNVTLSNRIFRLSTIGL